MNNFEDLFLDYIEGTLAPEARREFEAAVANDSAMARALTRYQKILEVERAAAAREYRIAPTFSVRVMAAIDEARDRKRLSSAISMLRTATIALSAAAAVLLVLVIPPALTVWHQVGAPRYVVVANERIEEGSVLRPDLFTVEPWSAEHLPENALAAGDLPKLSGKRAQSVLYARLPVVREQIGDRVPSIYVSRAVTVTVPRQLASEAKPYGRADLIYSAEEEGDRVVTTLAQSVPLLAVEQQGETIKVTLLVSESDARLLERIQGLGSLDLALVTDEDARSAEQSAAPEMQSTDAATGEIYTYHLLNGVWMRTSVRKRASSQNTIQFRDPIRGALCSWRLDQPPVCARRDERFL